MTTDPIAAARAMIEPLTGYTPKPWSKHKCLCGHPSCNQYTISTQGSVGFVVADARLIVAAPDLRDMVPTLADALEAERAKVAAAYEAAAELVVLDHVCDSIRALAPSDAQAALDKLLEEARLEGWRAGRDAAAESAHKYAAKCSEQSEDSRYNERFETASYFEIGADAVEYIARTISVLPEPKDASHDD